MITDNAQDVSPSFRDLDVINGEMIGRWMKDWVFLSLEISRDLNSVD